MEEIVLYEKKDKIAVVTVNRADALNALNKDVNLALLDCLDKAAADDDVRVVILTGSGNRRSSPARTSRKCCLCRRPKPETTACGQNGWRTSSGIWESP